MRTVKFQDFVTVAHAALRPRFYTLPTYMATTAQYFDSILLYAKERPWAALFIFTKEESGRSFKCLRNHPIINSEQLLQAS